MHDAVFFWVNNSSPNSRCDSPFGYSENQVRHMRNSVRMSWRQVESTYASVFELVMIAPCPLLPGITYVTPYFIAVASPSRRREYFL